MVKGHVVVNDSGRTSRTSDMATLEYPPSERWNCDSQTKAVLLNDPFSSVFTKEYPNSILDLKVSPHQTIRNIEIRFEGVWKLLPKINPDKASGPDNLPARLLKEC